LLIEKKEQEIVSRAQDNPVSFAPLYDYYFPKIYNYIYNKVNNSQLAEDLVSETFYKALANIKKFQWQDRSFACWLYTIARNQVIDQFRKRDPILFDNNNTALTAQTEKGPEEKVIRDVTREELFKAIRTLSPDQQDALLLRYQEDLKIKEIAVILGKNEGAVKALLFRGLRSLRKKLKGGDFNAAI
jgi:RNA polymerase sigma-70 factor (ECF subfamily)